MVTQDGSVAKELGRFPVTGGAAEVPDVPLADPALRWAIRIVDTVLSVPVCRSGPLGTLPGGPRSHIFGDRIRLHRGGGFLGLDAPDGAPQVLIDYVRDNLPQAFQLAGIDLGADAQGRYVLTFRGRYRPLPVVSVDLEYRRGFAVAPGIDAGRPRRVAVACRRARARASRRRCSPPSTPSTASWPPGWRRRCRRWRSTSAS
jgi:hypothetical protein